MALTAWAQGSSASGSRHRWRVSDTAPRPSTAASARAALRPRTSTDAADWRGTPRPRPLSNIRLNWKIPTAADRHYLQYPFIKKSCQCLFNYMFLFRVCSYCVYDGTWIALMPERVMSILWPTNDCAVCVFLHINLLRWSLHADNWEQSCGE